jgi:hypothetical protein
MLAMRDGPRWQRAVACAALVATLAVALAPGARAATGPALAVDGEAGRHHISPDIYGMNFAEPALASELALPVDRWGGNATETYNFHIGADNTGNDWYFENVADCWEAAHDWCSGLTKNNVFAYREFVAADHADGAKTLFNLPLMGYVAGSAPVGQPLPCSFPATEFPDQESFDPYDQNCGDGLREVSKGESTELPSDPSRAGTPVTTAYDGEFVQDLVSRFGRASEGGVSVYELGNEPGLWDSTHRDLHPAPTTYDELWEKSRDAALEVKAQDPSAETLGFSEWGWPNYFCSAADGAPQQACTPQSPDRAAHGGTPLVEWFLQQFHDYEEEHGTRLLNYIDVHYYAQGGENAEVTRSLWDPTYTDPSWIDAKIDLIPRMHEWVDNNYPGTKIALSEYNLSVSSSPVVNALIQADTLGIFAREELSLATRWAMPNDGPLIDDAFRMFRNYNGAHGQFGNTWVQSTSSDSNQLAVYGAQRSSDGAYTVLVVNNAEEPLTSPLTLTGLTPAASAKAWQWTGGSIEHKPDQSIGAGGLTATYPAQSMTLLVIPKAATAEAPSPASPSPKATTDEAPTPASPSPTATGQTVAPGPPLAVSGMPGALGVSRVRDRSHPPACSKRKLGRRRARACGRHPDHGRAGRRGRHG